MNFIENLPPLGARLAGGRADFAVCSRHAEAIDVCLFDRPDAPHESSRHAMTREADGVWRLGLPAVESGTAYGLRSHGPWRPDQALRFNSSKLLVDPLAAAVCGNVAWHPALQCSVAGDPAKAETTDSAPWAPRGLLLEEQPAVAPLPPRASGRGLIYECHVRGMTMAHPEVPPALRGTYLGLAHPSVVEHLLALGVAAVELLPVQQRFDEEHLVRRGQTNYWGYAPLALAAPEARYATRSDGTQCAEFRAMVSALHEAGLEVIVDLVFNHTAEGDWRGPSLSLRGLDDADYYLHEQDGHYRDWSGCGHTLACARPNVVALVVAALRRWRALGVDGFRFDLAAVLGRREDGHFDAHAPLLAAIASDPLLAGARLIAEPWDLGPGAVGPGRFAEPWKEWNDAYRKDLRSLWRGDRVGFAALATRLGGSSDIFGARAGGPAASVNYLVSHDGFTLEDWTSFEQRRNQANGEDGRDGNDHEQSRNWGVEGPSDDPAVLGARDRAAAAMLATLFVSLGVPMLAAGDECGRSQGGNNNPYCIDDPTTWMHWNFDGRGSRRLALVRRLAQLRDAWPCLRRERFFEEDDVTWLRPDARPMEDGDWHDPALPALVLVFAEGARRLLVAFNPPERRGTLVLPEPGRYRWRLLLDTAALCAGVADGPLRPAGEAIELEGGAVLIFEGDAP
jgi:glycogen debranching enzyme GlgX